MTSTFKWYMAACYVSAQERMTAQSRASVCLVPSCLIWMNMKHLVPNMYIQKLIDGHNMYSYRQENAKTCFHLYLLAYNGQRTATPFPSPALATVPFT